MSGLRPPETCAVYGAPADGFLRVLDGLGVPHRPVTSLNALEEFRCVIVVAGAYPDVLKVDGDALERYLRAGGNAYVEYATGGFLPAAAPRQAGFERIHTAEPSDITAPFPPLSVFDEHCSWTMPVAPAEGAVEVLTYGRVAGTHTAVFGPAAESWPALVDLRVGAGRLLYATTALSNFERGRYRPEARWRTLIRNLLGSLAGVPVPAEPALVTHPRVWARSGEPVTVELTGAAGPVWWRQPGGVAPVELPMAEIAPGRLRSAPLELEDGAHAFASGEANTAISIGPREERYRRMVERGIAWYDRAGMFFGEPDAGRGVAEGLSNEVGVDGVHPLRDTERADCFVQTAYAFTLYHELTGDSRARRVADNLMSLVLERSQLTDRNALHGSWEPRGPRTDFTYTNNLFADDNGWISLFAMALGGFEQGLRGVEALVRTAHERLGMQTDPWRTPSTLLVEGWAGLARRPLRDGLDLSAHWNSSAQAAMLYAYASTGERRYLDVATRGLDHMAASLPTMRLETSRTCEVSRLLFPLAGALHYTGKPLYRDALRQIAGYLKSRQDPVSGAIAEWDGRNPGSNEAYGVDEASVFQANGDRVTDQLYAMGFAAMSLPIACRVTGEAVFAELATGVLDYLSRIQLDIGDPRLDGTWMRAFDFGIWEYFGSNCDVGWGPYCVETGWSHAPALIGAMLHLTGGRFFPDTVEPRHAVAGAVAKEFDEIEAGLPVAPMFFRDGNGAIRRKQGVESIVGDLVAAGDPAWAENPAAASVEIYARGVDGLLHHTYLHDRLGQGAWRPVGDLAMGGDPAVAFNPAADAVEVYVRGMDGRVHHTTLVDPRAGHAPWEAVGTLRFAGDPSVRYDASHATVEITAQAVDGRVYRTIKANRWHRPWVPVDEPGAEHLPWRVA